jgi:hypothetical protein
MKFLAALFILASALAVAQQKPKPAPAEKPYACVAGPDEQCASDLWFADYTKMVELRKQAQEAYAKSGAQEKFDLANGIDQRLGGQVPPGFRWDAEKKRFVKIASPAALAPPASTKSPEVKK